jgi:hypothetical protein
MAMAVRDSRKEIGSNWVIVAWTKMDFIDWGWTKNIESTFHILEPQSVPLF